MQKEIAYNESNYEAESFELILGYTPGYNNEELEKENEFDSIESFNALYYKIAQEIYDKSGVFVTALTFKSRVVYPGSPRGGEKVYFIKGTRNPEFTSDKEKYRKAVNEVARILADILQQTTYSISWTNCNYNYFKKQ